jgi:hypothetical protein
MNTVRTCLRINVLDGHDMNWSKVKKPTEKPIKWWCYKLLCEFWYNYYGTSNKRYYKYLNLLCDMGWNLYGDKI